MVAEHMMTFHQKVDEGSACQGGRTYGGDDPPPGALEVNVGKPCRLHRCRSRNPKIAVRGERGVGEHVGDEFSPFLCLFFFHDVIPVQCPECQKW